MKDGLLLFPVAALLVEPTENPLWFRRDRNAYASVISDFGNVSDVLLRLPESWNVIPGGRLEGLHDDEDIATADPRFNGEMDECTFAIVRHTDRRVCVALLLISAVEAILLPKRWFRQRDRFDACVPGVD